MVCVVVTGPAWSTSQHQLTGQTEKTAEGQSRDRLGQHWPAIRHNEQTVTLRLSTVTRNMDTSSNTNIIAVTTNTYSSPGGLNISLPALFMGIIHTSLRLYSTENSPRAMHSECCSSNGCLVKPGGAGI